MLVLFDQDDVSAALRQQGGDRRSGRSATDNQDFAVLVFYCGKNVRQFRTMANKDGRDKPRKRATRY